MQKAICLLCFIPILACARIVMVDDVFDSLNRASGAEQAASMPPRQERSQIQPAPPKEVWIAEIGSTLRETIEKWGVRAKWTIEWDTKTDYLIRGPLRFEGEFDQAVAQFIRLYERAERPLVADVSLRQRLIYITTRN